jgi:hypothetical protein
MRIHRDQGFAAVMIFALLGLAGARVVPAQAPRVIEILADRDSRYKIAGQKEPSITAHANEPLLLRITAVKAKQHNRNGAIHGFTLLRGKDRSQVPGWDFELKPGMQEFMVTAPGVPGDYVVVCTVICGPNHEGMNMPFTVLPQ